MLDFAKTYKKEIALAALAIVGLLLLFMLFKAGASWIENLFSSKENPDTSGTIGEPDTNNLTWNETHYSTLADRLEQAMQTAFDDADQVPSIIDQLQTQDDLIALIRAFGQRTNYWFGVPTYTGGLVKWLQDELSTSDLAEVQQIFNRLNVPL